MKHRTNVEIGSMRLNDGSLLLDVLLGYFSFDYMSKCLVLKIDK